MPYQALVAVTLKKLKNRDQAVVDSPRNKPLVKAVASEFQDVLAGHFIHIGFGI